MASSDKSFEVRFARVDDETLAAHALPPWREKALRMRFPHDARLELVAGGLLGQMLAEHGILSPRFTTNPYGKPLLLPPPPSPPPPPHFNLSHSGDVVMCVLAEDPVGCDVERVVLEPGRDRAFYEAWTHREARLKALGCGFASTSTSSLGLNLFSRPTPAPCGYVASVCLARQST